MYINPQSFLSKLLTKECEPKTKKKVRTDTIANVAAFTIYLSPDVLGAGGSVGEHVVHGILPRPAQGVHTYSIS